jgi:hypothetical protein
VQPGLLLVGGFHLSGHELDLLEEAAKSILGDLGPQMTHIGGIIILAVGSLIKNPYSPAPGCDLFSRESSLELVITLRVAHSPAYQGKVAVDTSDRPGLQKVTGPIMELTLPPFPPEA